MSRRSRATLASLLADGRLATPQELLGPRRSTRRRERGLLVRAWHPDAKSAELLREGSEPVAMDATEVPGLFEAFLPGVTSAAYRFRLAFPDGAHWECEDPYRFPSTLGDLDVHLFAEGTHRRLWEVLGSQPVTLRGVAGVVFRIWAPGAQRVSVVGDFCQWDGLRHPLCSRGEAGLFELFVPGLAEGELYKFEIVTPRGDLRLKADPFARAMERPPANASRVTASHYTWGDDAWLERRAASDPRAEPLAVYEVHLGSWRRGEDGRWLGYREIAPLLADHVEALGFTHVELLPVMEHPLDASWGYQVTAYFAPTSRHGTPDDLRFLVDHLHQRGIGVLLDWVPAHFPRDDWALRRFVGEPLYEYGDPRLGEQPDWGTLVFDFGRPEVRGFLVANALYWISEFHVDGLRVDAVASMLYRDYSRDEGAWLPNVHGGRENYEAIELLRAMNRAVGEEFPGAMTVAEESTSWAGVTADPGDGGLGFTFKWNMGWMHDTLSYFARDPVHRSHHQDEITFAAIYEHTEHFLMPLSHDEVVHGKRSLLEKMPGDPWQKLANLRLLLAYQMTRPGKKLLFMGSELAPSHEWNHDAGLDWSLADDPPRAGLLRLTSALLRLYRDRSCFWRTDAGDGFRWLDCGDWRHSVLSYERRDAQGAMLAVLNFTPVPRGGYRVGVPEPGRYALRLSTDASEFGGSGYPTPAAVDTQPVAWHGFGHSIEIDLPPLAAILLEREA
ncbi:MAG: 1,4-alpha-glucan branching protein GlgB [Myxococcota bacterium]